MIDLEVRQMVDAAYKRTLDLMVEKKQQVIQVAELLLKQETISHTDVANLIGDRYFLFLLTFKRINVALRPYSAGKEYDMFVAHTKRKNDTPPETSDSKSSTLSDSSSENSVTPNAATLQIREEKNDDLKSSNGETILSSFSILGRPEII
jgi:AFG3 family protein